MIAFIPWPFLVIRTQKYIECRVVSNLLYKYFYDCFAAPEASISPTDS